MLDSNIIYTYRNLHTAYWLVTFCVSLYFIAMVKYSYTVYPKQIDANTEFS